MKEKVVAFITGCSTGIGRQLCSLFAQSGYIVVATARKIEDLSGFPASLSLPLDVTDAESIRFAMERVGVTFGRIDVLINNAGISNRGALEEVDLQTLKETFNVNVFGLINVVQAALPLLRKSAVGKIINIGSISGRFSQPVNGSYCASKYAVESITETLRLELFKQSIQVTVIEPGPVRTNFFSSMERKSVKTLANKQSPYAYLYERDQKRKKGQAYASQEILKIAGGKKLKPRYQIAVPLAFKLIASFPHSLREYLLLHG
jgi:NADP-dependent 3-hydroxy acid dehydrogenase YdfG